MPRLGTSLWSSCLSLRQHCSDRRDRARLMLGSYPWGKYAFSEHAGSQKGRSQFNFADAPRVSAAVLVLSPTSLFGTRTAAKTRVGWTPHCTAPGTNARGTRQGTMEPGERMHGIRCYSMHRDLSTEQLCPAAQHGGGLCPGASSARESGL